MKTKTIFPFVILMLLFFASCKKEELRGTNISQLFHLQHKGATMPILVEGNIDSDVIILFLHGGPGESYRAVNTLITKMTDPLEEKYALVYWDQRVAGNSRASKSATKLSLELMTEDVDKVVDFLKYKFGENKKIFLAGHSWGGMLGTSYLIDAKRQEKISGWIEIAGAHDIPRTNKEALALILKVASEQVAKGISVEPWNRFKEILKDIDKNNFSNADAILVNQTGYKVIEQAKLDGLIKDEQLVDENFNTLYKYSFYDRSFSSTLSNKVELSRTDFFKNDIINGLSLSPELHHIRLPSLFLYSKYDFIVPSPQGIDAYNNISTSDENKKIIIFEHSGHDIFTSELDLFLKHFTEFVEEYK